MLAAVVESLGWYASLKLEDCEAPPAKHRAKWACRGVRVFFFIDPILDMPIPPVCHATTAIGQLHTDYAYNGGTHTHSPNKH